MHYQKDYPHPSQVYPNDKFISIAVPTFCRPFYLEKLLDTLAQYADMPYEVVVCDDASRQDFRDQLYRMSDRISVAVFNNGINAGLVTAANRCIAMASSKYVLFLNDDCFFVDKCLKDICNVLSKPYVGVISPANEPGPLAPHEAMNANGTRFAISNFLGGGSVIAFRKKVWEEVGGWDERSPSGQADNVFIYKILCAGYWKALLEGRDRVKVGNFVYGDDYKPTQPYQGGNDCSLPKIFGMDKNEWIRLNHARREACQFWVDGERTIDEGNGRGFYDDRPNPKAGLNDIPYWDKYFQAVFNNKNSHSVLDINWDAAALHGHTKWRGEILKDYESLR